MAKKKSLPKIFISYSEFDEKHDRGRLSALCKRLLDEVRLQTGENWPVFLDRDTIKTGENWKSNVQEALENSDILIALITPNYFKSQGCRHEIEGFLNKEKQSERKPLIIPIMYLGSQDRLAQDELGKEVIKRDLLDWRDLRFEPFTSPRLKREMEKAASAISDAIEASDSGD